MERQLGVGATLREIFEIYRDQAGVLLPVAFWLFLAVDVIGALARGNFVLTQLTLMISVAIGFLYQGMVVGLVQDIQDGRRDSSVGDLMRSVLPVLGPLIGAGILAGFGIGLGLLLFAVPGLYLQTIWVATAPVIMVERHGIFDAFGRSRQLVRGDGWRVFSILLIAYLVASILLVAQLLIEANVVDGPLLRIVFGALISTIAAPIAALVASVLYYRLVGLQPVPEGGVGTPSENTPSA